MKYRTRAKLAIAGFGLFCATALFGAAYRIVEVNKSVPVESSHPVQYTIKCEPIIEPEEKSNSEIVHMDSVVTEVESKSEPQIEESKSDYQYEPPFYLTEYEIWFVKCVVAGEAGGESYEGKLAVAQCYFDAMLKDGLSATEVKSVYRYNGWNENLDKQDKKAYDEVENAVMDIFYGGKFVTEKPILFFYNPDLCQSDWHEAQEFEMEIGGHRFFYLTEDENVEWANILLTNQD